MLLLAVDPTKFQVSPVDNRFQRYLSTDLSLFNTGEWLYYGSWSRVIYQIFGHTQITY
jgi:hypothetical protein